MIKKSGFLLINKPAGLPRGASAQWGPTSHDIIDELRKITGVRKIGHAGTLDPFASGLLITAVGREATRRISEFLKMDKTYTAKIRLGATSDTQDRTGVIKSLNHKIKKSKEEIAEVLKKFTGKQTQIPPMYSAKKIGGKKLYELARKGIEIPRKPAEVNIHYIKLLSIISHLSSVTIETRVSSGTYIRSLAHDIGQALDCGAYLEELERTKIGDYTINDAAELKNITKENWTKYLKNI